MRGRVRGTRSSAAPNRAVAAMSSTAHAACEKPGPHGIAMRSVPRTRGPPDTPCTFSVPTHLLSRPLS